jgi:hypothetical protein
MFGISNLLKALVWEPPQFGFWDKLLSPVTGAISGLLSGNAAEKKYKDEANLFNQFLADSKATDARNRAAYGDWQGLYGGKYDQLFNALSGADLTTRENYGEDTKQRHRGILYKDMTPFEKEQAGMLRKRLAMVPDEAEGMRAMVGAQRGFDKAGTDIQNAAMRKDLGPLGMATGTAGLSSASNLAAQSAYQDTIDKQEARHAAARQEWENFLMGKAGQDTKTRGFRTMTDPSQMFQLQAGLLGNMANLGRPRDEMMPLGPQATLESGRSKWGDIFGGVSSALSGGFPSFGGGKPSAAALVPSDLAGSNPFGVGQTSFGLDPNALFRNP